MSAPSDQTILITGATGFVGSHVLQALLTRGYNAHLAVRSPSSSISSVISKFPSQYHPQISFATVPDITKPELFEDAFSSSALKTPITAVIHTAAPFLLDVEDTRRDLLDPIINSSIAILEATKRYGGPQVKRIVNTSSFAAILDLAKGNRPGYVYSEQDWNPMTYQEASQANATFAYCAAKGLAEKAMWDWVKAEKPWFDLVSVNPPWVFGPHVGGVNTSKLNESSAALYSLLGAKEIPGVDFAGFVDVRTIADAHVAALEKKEASGQRFLVGKHFDYQSAVDSLRESLPQIGGRLPLGKPGTVPETYDLDGSKAERVLGIKYTPIVETMRDSFGQFLEAEKRELKAAA